VGKILKKAEERGNVVFEVSHAPEYDRYLVPKGSVALEGISLTVVEADSGRFSVA